MPDPTTMNRRRFLASSAAVAATATAGSITPAAAQAHGRPPNIVFVLADDLGYGELGSYGQELIRTPNLDRLATEGMLFSQFYAGAAVCAPSRCTLLTGRHTGRCSVRTNPLEGPASAGMLTPDEPTFGNVVRAAGYRTGLFGKWGFGPEEAGHHSHPGPKGFEEFFGYITHNHAHTYYPDYLWENDRTVSVPENADGARGAFAPDLFAARALDFVERHRDEPFLLVLSTNVPHFPQDVPDLGEYADLPWRDAEKAHAAQITRMDADVGRIVDLLERLSLAQDTLVFVTSDNGPHQEGNPRLDPLFFDATGPLRGIKRNLYEGGIRVPMLVWGPGLLKGRPGTVIHDAWTTWDVLPTLAEIAGAPVPSDLDGDSMGPVLLPGTDPAPGQRAYLYWYRLERFQSPLSNATDQGRGRQVCEALRRGQWKAVRFAPGTDRSVPDEEWEVELYNLGRDPGEQDDVAVEHPQVVVSLVSLMHHAWVEP
ncbi:arylsulfatase [Jiangella asiatica]|uniref:Tat pathway signal sequence domain protein n=1 Tax=Jiangella asiatica TaxID=2530372 RepID=A0A4R5CR88_9ACTN|nr:arylsulfatase [Jiangella asiatica]TDE00215.1 Tat pathway signal sequence domain protein [Jiangella asiatica]